MDYDRCGPPSKTIEKNKIINRISKPKVQQKSLNCDPLETEEICSFDLLTSVCLEKIACYLDIKSALNLLITAKKVHDKLVPCVYFWKQMCKNECFDKYNALKTNDEDDNSQRLAWSGQKFHDLDMPEEATYWQKVFQRGIQMRRNIVEGRFEMFRLFMTDADSLPVKKMSWDTSFRELRSFHRKSPFNDTRRRVRINRYWNEDFLIVIQHNVSHTFNDIFVWSWKECQNPTFLYSYDLLQKYPTGLFPTSFYLWKNFMVLMPETGYIPNARTFTSVIRVHDLNKGFEKVGSYDFPEDSKTRRHLKINSGNEAAHLHRLHDKAVALCRTPQLTFYIFSVPNCQLLQSFPVLQDPSRSLDLDDLDQRFLMKENTMMFMFHDPEFFNHLFTSMDGTPHEMKYGRFLQVEFDDYIKTNGKIQMRIDNKFDCNDDYIEKISMVNKSQMACALSSGKIVVRDIVTTNATTISFVEKLAIPCNEPLQEEFDEELDEEVDTDGPSLCCGSNGNLIIALRHFVSGRKVHAYDSNGGLLYELCIDLPTYDLERQPGYLSIDLDGNFLCAADQNKIVIWNSKTGHYVRTIMIPEHYNFKDDTEESADKFCWKGHTDFAFTEDGIIIIHSQRNFPIAADILLFW